MRVVVVVIKKRSRANMDGRRVTLSLVACSGFARDKSTSRLPRSRIRITRLVRSLLVLHLYY